MYVMRIIAVIVSVAGCCLVGCSKSDGPTKGPTSQSQLIVKRVPCKVKFGPLAAALEIDLSELKNLVLDSKQLYSQIINGEPDSNPPERGNPVIMVVNKKTNKFTYFQLTPNVKEIRIKHPAPGTWRDRVRRQKPGAASGGTLGHIRQGCHRRSGVQGSTIPTGET